MGPDYGRTRTINATILEMKSREFTRGSQEIVVIAHNIRSIMNLGSIVRTAEGFGVSTVFTTGWTASPDKGLPHVQKKMAGELHKTALGAEDIVAIHYRKDVSDLLGDLKQDGYRIVGLEQSSRSIPLPDYQPPDKIALLLGEEVGGVTAELLELCDDTVEIPMFGHKESFNVSVATGIALYELARETI